MTGSVFESYYNAVLWAVKNQVTTGKSKTSFAPDDPVLNDAHSEKTGGIDHYSIDMKRNIE